MTLTEWTDQTVAGIITTLPLQDETYTGALVTTYISGAGGWVPDSGLDPTGPGVMANGASPATAIAAIIADQYSRIYESSLTLSLDLNFRTINHLTPGLSEVAVRAAIDGPIRDDISDFLISKGFVVSNLALNASTTTVDGVFNAARRVALEVESPVLSVCNVGLRTARTQYGLDVLWSISHAYIKTNSPVALIIKKYTSSAYTTIDSGVTYFYLVKVDPVTKRVISGTKTNL